MYLQNGISLNCLLLGETSNENFQVDIAENEEHLLEKVEENNIKDILSGEMMKPDYMVKEYFSIKLVLENIHNIVHVPSIGPGLQAGCMKQLTTTLNLGNSLLNGKFCLLYGNRQSPRQLLLMQ
ncbi:unnamed protein product [Rhizophagus irregularis]|nr:unnamed protein product [Rhizophagus irregularis]